MPSPLQIQLVATHSYRTSDPSHLSFPARAIITARPGQEGNTLWYGTDTKNNRSGWFNPSYCRLQAPALLFQQACSSSSQHQQLSRPTSVTKHSRRNHSYDDIMGRAGFHQQLSLNERSRSLEDTLLECPEVAKSSFSSTSADEKRNDRSTSRHHRIHSNNASAAVTPNTAPVSHPHHQRRSSHERISRNNSNNNSTSTSTTQSPQREPVASPSCEASSSLKQRAPLSPTNSSDNLNATSGSKKPSSLLKAWFARPLSPRSIKKTKVMQQQRLHRSSPTLSTQQPSKKHLQQHRSSMSSATVSVVPPPVQNIYIASPEQHQQQYHHAASFPTLPEDSEEDPIEIVAAAYRSRQAAAAARQDCY